MLIVWCKCFLFYLAPLLDDGKLLMNIFEVACDFCHRLITERSEALEEILRGQVIVFVFFQFNIDYRWVQSDFWYHFVVVQSLQKSFFWAVGMAQRFFIEKAYISDVDDMFEVDIGKEFGGREFLFFE